MAKFEIGDLAIPLLIGVGMALVISNFNRKTAIVAAIDIAAAPDPVKCKAFDDAKVNSPLIDEPCSQVCGTPSVGGDATKCKECETVCGAPNCGCFGTNADPGLCDKHGAITTAGCTNPRASAGGDSGDSGGGDDNEDNEDDNDGGGGGSSKSKGMNAKEYTKATTPAQRAAANKKIEALSKYASTYW